MNDRRTKPDPRRPAGEVQTRNRVIAWWLSIVRGYRVKSIRIEPIPARFGGVAYKRMWLLSPPR